MKQNGLPLTWSHSTIGDLAIVRTGRTPSRTDPTNFGGDIPWVKTAEVTDDVIYTTEEHLSENGRETSKSEIFPAGSILVALYGQGQTRGRTALLGVPAATNQACAVILPTTKTVQRYLWWWLRASYVPLRDLGRGGNQPNLNLEIVRTFGIPVPPLPEQGRIAAILDKADTIRRKREEGIGLTKELLRSAFLELFGDPVKNERGWPIVKIEEAGQVQLGRQRAPKYQSGKHTHPYLRVANVFEDRIDLNDVLSMDFDESDFKTYRLRHGDILLNEGQSTELVGRPAMWRDELPECCFQNTLIRFRANPERMEPEYALEVFLYYLRKGQFARLSSKTSSVAHLGAGRFAEMPVPLPPLKLQRHYSEKRRQIHSLLGKRQGQVQEANDLFGSLVQRAFRGEL